MTTPEPTTAPERTTWYARIEVTGNLTNDQLEQLAAGATMLHYDSHTRIATLELRITADNLTDATTTTLATIDQHPGLQTLLAANTVQPPRAITVQNAAAHADGLRLLGAAETANRLNISTARLRELRKTRPDFPAAEVTLAGGSLWDPAKIDHFNRNWDRSFTPTAYRT